MRRKDSGAAYTVDRMEKDNAYSYIDAGHSHGFASWMEPVCYPIQHSQSPLGKSFLGPAGSTHKRKTAILRLKVEMHPTHRDGAKPPVPYPHHAPEYNTHGFPASRHANPGSFQSILVTSTPSSSLCPVWALLYHALLPLSSQNFRFILFFQNSPRSTHPDLRIITEKSETTRKKKDSLKNIQIFF